MRRKSIILTLTALICLVLSVPAFASDGVAVKQFYSTDQVTCTNVDGRVYRLDGHELYYKVANEKKVLCDLSNYYVLPDNKGGLSEQATRNSVLFTDIAVLRQGSGDIVYATGLAYIVDRGDPNNTADYYKGQLKM